ncbi:MAG: (Fe-S)-binding protein [Deltaproteobacteria bacterium]|nr:(Fe-S)-binding protein [Deltaproteobacteria bacterium]MBW2152547.1 (Fe-S)-binding protein [Deltaproteobacteria bacterium]
MKTFQDIVQKNRAWYCMECGKCGAVCPIGRYETYNYTSPRLLVAKAMNGSAAEVMENGLFWSCLTCKRCSELCPSDVYFSEFIRDARSMARDEGHFGPCTHGEVIQTWGRIMTDPALKQNRLGWISNDLAVSEDSDTVFFVGCTPHYDTLFRHLNIEGVEIARAAVKILNYLGIAPHVMSDERCCGHDQLWEGDFETFSALAKINLKRLAATGAKRIVTACPECARTLKYDYPHLVGRHGMEVLHICEVLDQAADAGRLMVKPSVPAFTVTYQDPCRLGRHMGVYDPPRRLLAAVGMDVAEMENSRNASLCCGTSCWTACGQISKQIQVERLSQARETGAQLLVTACIKCQIHFRCAQLDPDVGPEIRIDIRDISTIVAERLTAQKENVDRQKKDDAA